MSLFMRPELLTDSIAFPLFCQDNSRVDDALVVDECSHNVVSFGEFADLDVASKFIHFVFYVSIKARAAKP